MIELPEAITLGTQVKNALAGKVVAHVFNATNPSKFTFNTGDPLKYGELLVGKRIQSAQGYGIFVDIVFDGDTTLSICDGVNMKYGEASTKLPEKYQLLLVFDDQSFLAFTVAMYGGIFVYTGKFDNKYHNRSFESISPLSKDFDEQRFESLFANEKKNLSVKALLATEQRIPGVGNGVLQDILFNANIHPKRKISTLTDKEKSTLFNSLKNTLHQMTSLGGRNTETNIFGNKGEYKSVLSKNTYKNPCPKCSDTIQKEAYLGGAVYYCPTCQKL